MKPWCGLLLLPFLAAVPRTLLAQRDDDALTQREVDALRDAAFEPQDRIKVFTSILDDRQKRIDTLLAKRRSHTDFTGQMHDVLDQFGKITDEFNDNLDDFDRRHRDIRKALPKLIEATERWSTSLRSVEDAEGYAVVRKIALDDVKDTRGLADSLKADLDHYFLLHPDALAQEKRRTADPHAVHDTEGPP